MMHIDYDYGYDFFFKKNTMADEIWSVTNEILELIQLDKIDIPILDVGIAHGEKARGGFI